MFTRRSFIKSSALAAGGLLLPWRSRRALAAIPGGTLPPGGVAKYVAPLIAPPPMPRTSRLRTADGQLVDYYEIAVRQFQQQILPASHPATTVWSYGNPRFGRSFLYPAYSIEARHGIPVRVKWINQLVDSRGNFLPHLLPVDPTLHWANPPGPIDTRPSFESTPPPYTGPVPMVTHVHGAHTHEESDGYPEAWYLPQARNIPGGYAADGTWYDTFRERFRAKWGVDWEPGTATFQYPNEQRATTLWFHDHTLGMTRQNVYAGPAGFYLLRGGDADLERGILPGNFPGPNVPSAGGAAGLNARAPIHEIPIAVQDRSFNADGSLFYPSSREFFDGYSGPYIPDTPVPPMWNPEFFGNMIVVNGQTWPYQEVERRRYRLRFLNGCNSRFLVLKLVTNRFGRDRHAPGDFPFWQIGSEGGFLPAPVELGALLIAPAERADVIVDFTNIPEGTAVYLVNDGPDEPFGGLPIEEEALADAESTMQVMRFDVVRRRGQDASLPPDQIVLPAITPLDYNQPARVVTLHEEEYPAAEIPVAALLGTESGPLMWGDAVTENPGLGETEVWEIRNFTEDAHPIHVHLVQFQVLDRQPMEGGAARPPEAWESGFKDTVIAYPGESTRIVARFDLPGRFVWHCHILEHEDNEMMRPYTVGE